MDRSPRTIQAKVSQMMQKIEIERFSLTSTKSFDEVLAAINDAIGHPEMAEFWKSIRQAQTLAELESTIQKVLGSSGLMSFVQFDHGEIVQKATGRATRSVRLVVGNPLIMKELASRVPDAGSYAPITILVDERADGVHLSYDRMASFLAPYNHPDALAVARTLDARVEDLLRRAAGGGQ